MRVGRLNLDDAHDVFFTHDEQFFAIDLNGLSGIFAKQNAITFFNVQRDLLAVVIALARANRNNFALIGFFGGGVRNNDARSGFTFFFEALDDHTIVQRTDFHSISP